MSGVGASIASSVNARRSRSRVESEQDILDKQHRQSESLFNSRYYQDMLDRTEIQQALSRQREEDKVLSARDAAIARVNGQTQEERLASADSRRKSRSGVMAEIASSASQLRDGILSQWMNSRDNYYRSVLGMNDKIAGIGTEQAKNWSQMAGNAMQAGGSILGGVDWDKLKGV